MDWADLFMWNSSLNDFIEWAPIIDIQIVVNLSNVSMQPWDGIAIASEMSLFKICVFLTLESDLSV